MFIGTLGMCTSGQVPIWGDHRLIFGGIGRMQHITTAGNVLILLSPRQCQVLVLVTSGLSNKEIAYALRIGLSAVKAHVSNMTAGLHLDNRVQLCRWALTHQSPTRGVAVDPPPVSLSALVLAA